MSSPDKIPVIQFGATGPVAEVFRDMVAHPKSPLTLEAIVPGSNDSLVGLRLGDTILSKHANLESVPIIGIHDAINNTDAPVVFSSVRNEVALDYEDKLAQGRLLATNAAPNRMRADVALLNSYFNPDQLSELFGMDLNRRIMANGNCMSIINTLAMSPIHREFGIKYAKIETLQGWSGAGKTKVPDNMVGYVGEITGEEAAKIETEPNKFLGSLATPQGILVTAKPHRAPWVRGHQAKLELGLEEPATKKQIETIWREFKPPKALRKTKYGPNSPVANPISVSQRPLVIPSNSKTFKLRKQVEPMSISARVDSIGRGNKAITIEVIGDNLVLGAAGSSYMNIVFAALKGYIR